MPAKVVVCTSKGQSGFKSSEGGTCYTGPGAKEKSTAQVQAINISKGKKEGLSWAMKIPNK